MREDLLRTLEADYARVRAENEAEENRRREEIRAREPEIYDLVRRRQELVFGTLRNILKEGGAETEGLPERMEQLSAAISEKLAGKGYPADYLSPVFRCALCRDRGWTGDPVREPCSCLKQAYRRKVMELNGLNSARPETFEAFRPDLFSDETLPGRTYSQRVQMSLVREICEKWADNYPNSGSRDMLLTGKSGLGKTFLLHAMAERLIERGADVTVISAYRLIDLLRRRYFGNEEGTDEAPDAEVLMIDDLGSEPLMQNVTVEQLFNLLNERQEKGLSTLISTNLDRAEFRNR